MSTVKNFMEYVEACHRVLIRTPESQNKDQLKRKYCHQINLFFQFLDDKCGICNKFGTKNYFDILLKN